MANIKRYLKNCIFGLTVASLAAVNSGAQSSTSTAEPPPVMFRTLVIGNTLAFSGLFYENKGKSIGLMVGDTSPSMPYESPLNGILSIYRESAPVPPETKPVRIPVAEVQLGKDAMYWVVLSAQTHQGLTTITPFVVSDSWEIHPFETVRVFNFSRRQIVVQVEGFPVELSPAASHCFPYPKSGKEMVSFKAATQDNDGWKVRINSQQGIIPKTRSSLVITDIEPSIWDSKPDGINVINMIDTISPPKTSK